MRLRITLMATAVLTFFAAAFVGALFYVSDMLLFPFKPHEKWTAVESIECSKWMKEWAYADLREGAPGSKPLDLSCDESLILPSQSYFTRNAAGERIHYKVYENLSSEQMKSSENTPIFLHVHGVSGTYMHGARYFKMATRLGFQLVAMDMSNHGLSDHNSLGASYGCREQYDVVAVVNALKAQYPGRRILLHATSMGSMAALNAAGSLTPQEAQEKNKSVFALALENPIPSVDQLAKSTPKRPPAPQLFLDLGVWLAEKRGQVKFSECEPVKAAPKVAVPTYIFNAVNDDIVSPDVSRQVADALPKSVVYKVRLFTRGGHSTVWNGNPAEVEQDLADLWKAAVASAPAEVVPVSQAVPAVNGQSGFSGEMPSAK